MGAARSCTQCHCFRLTPRKERLKFQALSYSSSQSHANESENKILGGSDSDDSSMLEEKGSYRHSPNTAMKFHFDINTEPFLTHQRNQSLNAAKYSNSSSSAQKQDVFCEHNVKFSICAKCGNRIMRQLFLGVEGNLLPLTASLSDSQRISDNQDRLLDTACQSPRQCNPFVDDNNELLCQSNPEPISFKRNGRVQYVKEGDLESSQIEKHKQSFSDTNNIIKKNPFE